MKDPLGICTFVSGVEASCVCPHRFLEKKRLFRDAGRLAFGDGAEIVVAPEMRILDIPGARTRRIGKVDYVLAKLNSKDQVSDFAALEVQAVYISGDSVKPAFHHYLASGNFEGQNCFRRIDPRSSLQKRLVPQLNLKVPVFRRWGKKFFVALDSMLFEHFPEFRTSCSIQNSEITWLVYRFAKTGERYAMREPKILYSLWEDVLDSLREGNAPTPGEIQEEIDRKKDSLLRIKL